MFVHLHLITMLSLPLHLKCFSLNTFPRLISLDPLICIILVILFFIRDEKQQKTTIITLCAAALYSDAFCSVSLNTWVEWYLLGFSPLLIEIR